MTIHLKDHILKDGKLVKKKSRKSVSQHIREKKSNRQRVVSKANAQLHSASRSK